MGKEQDLLEASRNGNYHVIEKNLMARMKKSGPLHLTSLRRLPGPNTTDPRNGFTCLHYASLNGHKDIVRILLEYGANPNVVDHNGSSPLHLASWTGDYEIVSMLISANNCNNNNSNNNNGIQPNDSNNCLPSNSNNKKLYADINLKNKDNETALHSACQYGHTAVVSLLLTQGADPFVQNIRQETPLDLASQYGRLETIELLLQLRFDLLNDYLTTTVNKNNNNNNDNHHHQQQLRQHSPLHLASRNGHKSIVKLLLDLGFNVNYLTVNGTALHEAVMCGKNEVVRMLLEAGTDIRLCNDRGQKVQQLIDGLNTSVAKQTRKLLREHMQRINDFNLANNGNYDNDDEEETMDRNELISPMSESTASHISNANNTNSHDGLYNNNNSQIIYGDHSQSEDQDLTIVDSMLNDEMNAFYNHFETANNDNQQDFDDLIMDDDDEDGTDIQCISPPPGYTDGDHINDDDHNNDSCHINPINPERIDCVSPSSSLFSTSIFSELASIFDEHLVNPPKNSTESKNNNLNQSSINGGSSMELHSSNQIKSSNSFTNDNEELIFRSTTFNQKFFNEGNNEKDPLHHHQSFNDVYCRDSPSRRMTTPNIMIGAVSSSSNIPAQNDNQAMMLIQSNQNHNNINNNNDSMTISSSNYSISSSVSSTTNMNNKHAMKIQPPLKPPRKSIDSKKVLKSKSIDQCSFVSSGLKIIDIQNDKPASLQLQNNRDDSRSSDLNDSSDHSTSQNMNSVISKKENEKTNRKQSSNKILNGINNNEKRNDNYNNSSLLSSTTHHSIDDFYLLYDQAAREEHEKEKINNHNQDHRLSMTNTQLNDQQQKQSTIREKAEQNNEPLMNSHNNNNNDDNDENISYGTNNDPPSPNSAETEIIHAIEPLKQQFYGNDNTSILLKITNNSISIEPKRTKRRKKAGQISKVNCQHHQPHEYRDNWTLTTQNDDQIIDENASNDNKKSIGIYVHLENVDKNAKLITKCGIDDHHQQQQPHHHHQHRNRSHNKNHSKRQQHQHQQQPTKQISDKQIQKQTATNVDQQKQSTNDYYSAYCETLKFDKKGEKENPFAGLCRGGLTPAKSVNNARTVAAGQSPQSQLLSSSGTNGTIEKKKKIVELSETRKSLRKQRSILSGGRAESMNKLNNNNHNGKLSVFNEDDKKSKSIDQRSSSTTLTGAMITQPNNIYATLRKKKKSKSFNGDNNAKLSAIDIDECCGEQNNGNDNKKYSTDKNDRSMNSNSILQDQSQQIFLWLKEIDMQEYKDILIRNGYDDLDFMDNNVMDDNDLIEIGIIQALHRDAILRAAQSLPYRTPKLTRDQLQKFSIEEWLSFIHLKQYVDIFKNNGLTELRKIRNIWEVELETMLEIDKCGHRRRILYSLSDFNQRDSMIVSDNSDALSPWLSTDNASTCTQNDRGRDKNDHQQQPQQQQSQWKGWKHARHELINGECQYLVNYLGSTLVRELRGIDSTRASIGKLKSSNMIDDGKISKILLSISCQGVQFQDSKTNRLICEHEIRNIHCICQDSEDLNYFAYITKDFETNNHYCHVFMSTQTDLVTEIILTLGQAFEIAYQIVLEQYNIHVKQQQQQHQTSTIKSCPANNVQNLSNTSTVKELENSSPPSSSSHNNNDNNCPDLNNQLNTTFVKVDQPQKSNSNVDNVIESSNNDNNNNKNSTKPSSPPPPPPQEKQFQELLFEQSNNLNKNKHIEEEIRLISPQPPLSSSPFIKMDQDLQQQQQQQPNKSKSINDDDDEIIAVGEQQQQQQQQQPQQEQLYAIVDKSRKNKITKLPFNNNLTQYQQSTSENDKENRPIPPIRSSSTASSNSSTGTRSDSRQQQLQQHQQQQQKPKPPVRVQSMQNQQKPEVSPKPKNLLNKSNTVTSSTTISLASASASVSTNLKPVLARYQPQLMLSTFQQQQQPQQQKLNEHRTITNHSIINSLPSPSSSSQSSMIKANQNNQMMI